MKKKINAINGIASIIVLLCSLFLITACSKKLYDPYRGLILSGGFICVPSFPPGETMGGAIFLAPVDDLGEVRNPFAISPGVGKTRTWTYPDLYYDQSDVSFGVNTAVCSFSAINASTNKIILPNTGPVPIGILQSPSLIAPQKCTGSLMLQMQAICFSVYNQASSTIFSQTCPVC